MEYIMMKGKAYGALGISVVGEKKGQGGNTTRAVLWGCRLLIAATAATLLVYNKQNKGKIVTVGKDLNNPLGSTSTVDIRMDNQESAPPSAIQGQHGTSSVWEDPAIERYHNASFPGMNDTNTTLGSCAARIIVDLERHFSQNISQSFTTLQFDNNNDTMCGSYIESVETYPRGCRLLPHMTDDDSPFGVRTIPFWVENCVTYYEPKEDANMTGFTVYYDMCSARLLWDARSCSDWINQTKELPREIVQNISLMDGEFTGMVLVSPNQWGENEPQTFIFIPDVFDSCWQVDCGWGDVNTTSCIQFAQENLLKVPLAHYVDTIKYVWCE